MIDVGRAVGIDARQQWHGRRELCEVVPVDVDAGRPGDGDQVQGVVGRSPGRQQADDAIDKGFFADDLGDGGKGIALWPQRDGALRGCARQRSEEHTSELQSLMRISYAVFCLKKKKTTR